MSRAAISPISPSPSKSAEAWSDMIRMSIDDWCNVPSYPGQRDTESRLKRALRYLDVPLATHTRVSMGVMRNGREFMLDGHTRALTWRRGLIQRPNYVDVHRYLVKDMDHARALYRSFDSPLAVESAADAVYGALRESGVVKDLGVNFLRTGKYLRALKMASGLDREQMIDAVRQYEIPLKLLDSIAPKKSLFVSWVLAVALLDLRVQGQPGLDFWVRYNEHLGTKTRAGYDAIEMLHLLHGAGKRLMTERDQKLCEKTLWLVQAYRHNPERRWKQMSGRSLLMREYALNHNLPYGPMDF